MLLIAPPLTAASTQPLYVQDISAESERFLNQASVRQPCASISALSTYDVRISSSHHAGVP